MQVYTGSITKLIIGCPGMPSVVPAPAKQTKGGLVHDSSMHLNRPQGNMTGAHTKGSLHCERLSREPELGLSLRLELQGLPQMDSGITGADLAYDERARCLRVQIPQGLIDARRVDHDHHPDAHVERSVGFVVGELSD